MAALTITSLNVILQSGVPYGDQISGEAFNAGALIIRADNNLWYKGQCDGTVTEAGSNDIGIALASVGAFGQRLSVAGPGCIVALGTGTSGIVYCIGVTQGQLVPHADLVSTNSVTICALGIGANKVLLVRGYNGGAIL